MAAHQSFDFWQLPTGRFLFLHLPFMLPHADSPRCPSVHGLRLWRWARGKGKTGTRESEPCRGSQRIHGHGGDGARRPLQHSPGEPTDRGARRAAVHGVAKSRHHRVTDTHTGQSSRLGVLLIWIYISESYIRIKAIRYGRNVEK